MPKESAKESERGAYLDRLIAAAPYKMVIQDGAGDPLIVISDRPLHEAAADVFRDAMQRCKPVPSVFGDNHKAGRRPIERHSNASSLEPVSLSPQ